VTDDVMAQLVATGKHTPAAAETQAKLWGAAMDRLGAMFGTDAFSLYQRYMGGIAAGTNAAEPSMTMDQAARPIEAFRAMTRDEFLGRPKITSNSNAADLVPTELVGLDQADMVPFKALWLKGRQRELTARYDADGAAVYDGDEV